MSYFFRGSRGRRCCLVDDIAQVVSPGNPLSVLKDVRLERHAGLSDPVFRTRANIDTVLVPEGNARPGVIKKREGLQEVAYSSPSREDWCRKKLCPPVRKKKMLFVIMVSMGLGKGNKSAGSGQSNAYAEEIK